MRGRVISMFVMVYASALPLGSLLVGAISQHIGVQATVLGEGILALGIGAVHLHHLQKNKLQQSVSPPPEQLTPEAVPPA